MATTATLTPVPSTGTNSSTTTDTNSKLNRKSPVDFDDLNSSNSTYRIPKRTNTAEMNESSTTKTLNRQSSDESNSQQGKRKFSLSQYKEHKRLKSNEIQQPSSLEDTDMRVNQNRPNYKAQTSSPTYVDDESVTSNDLQSIVSPKSEEISKDPVMKSNLSEPGVKKVNKKKVIWADEKSQSLVQTSFFEVDDSELSDMHIFARQCAANISIAQLEKVMERDLRKKRGNQDNNSNDNDDKQYSTPLPRLIKIIIPDTIQIPQIISQERFIQEEREKTVLQALFIRKFLPDSPGEPDGESVGTNTNNSEPKLIPLEDDSSSTISNKISSATSNNSSLSNSVSNSTTAAVAAAATTTTTTPSLSTTFSFANISPEVAQILAQAKGNASTAQTTTLPNTTTPPTAAAITATTTSTIPNTNLPAPPPNLLSALLNVTARTTNNETLNLPPPPNSLANLLPNLPLGFNLPPPPPPTPFPLSLIANALSLGIPPPPPPTAANPSLFQPNPGTFTAPPTLPNLSNPLGNNSGPPSSISTPTGNNSKPPSVRFVSAMGAQPRPNLANNDHSMSSSRENSRDHHFRRGSHHHHHHNRRDYYNNRNNNNNNNNNHNNNNNNNNNNHNNRNIFS